MTFTAKMPTKCVFCNIELANFKNEAANWSLSHCTNCKPFHIMANLKNYDSKYVVTNRVDVYVKETAQYNDYAVHKYINCYGPTEITIYKIVKCKDHDMGFKEHVLKLLTSFDSEDINLKDVTEDKIKLWLTFS